MPIVRPSRADVASLEARRLGINRAKMRLRPGFRNTILDVPIVDHADGKADNEGRLGSGAKVARVR